MNRRWIAKIAVLSLAVLLPTISAAKVYEYVDYSDSEEFAPAGSATRIDTDAGLIYGQHDSASIRTCKPEEGYYCIYANVFNFAVPKSPLSVGKTWTYHKFRYDVVRKQRLSFVGSAVDVYVISAAPVGSARHQSYTSTYFYSESRGLIATKAYYPAMRRAYFLLLSGETGFPK